MTVVTTFPPDKLRQLRQVEEMEMYGHGTVPNSPFALKLKPLYAQGFVRMPLESKAWCKPMLTDRGRAVLAQNAAIKLPELPAEIWTKGR